MLVDSHCHLEMESFDEDREALIDECLKEGMRYMLTVGTEEAYFEKVIALIDKYPVIYGALGIHPHNSGDFTGRIAGILRQYAGHPKIVALGEIGLDFFKNHAPRQTQEASFAAQLALAAELALPVIIHSRDAEKETLARLFAAHKDGVRGVIHCYSYGIAFAKAVLDMGFFVSIPGTITYKKTEELVDVVAYVPEDRLLVETDAPFLTPHPYRGKRNVPHYVKLTLDRVAAIRGVSAEYLAPAICRNFETLFLVNKGDATI